MTYLSHPEDSFPDPYLADCVLSVPAERVVESHSKWVNEITFTANQDRVAVTLTLFYRFNGR